MAQEFGFFADEMYSSDDFSSYFRDFYSNGIMADNSNYFAVIAKSGMSLTIKSGTAYIDGHFYRPVNDAVVTLAQSDTQYSRIDLVQIKCDYVTSRIYVEVVTGEAKSTPTIPTLKRDASAYCLGLAAVTVKANASAVTQADIQDLRFNAQYCGAVVGKIDTIDTSDLFAQYEAQWELLKAGCAQDAEAVINAWSALNALKTINNMPPTNGNINLTQSLIPSDSTAYQMPYYIQSGTVTVTTSIRDGTSITFPKAFKSTPMLALAGPSSMISGNPHPAPVIVTYGNLSSKGFTLYPFGFSSTGEKYSPNSMVGTARWFAMGKV